MSHKYIPLALKEKTLNFSRIMYGIVLASFSIFTFLSLISFSMNDNSFLTNSSNDFSNVLGFLGSYYASFLLYTFGILSYLVGIYFFIYSLLVFIKKTPDYFFIRLFVFFISLILIPQYLVFWGISFNFYPEIQPWGVFANKINILHNIEFLNYFLSLLGLVLYFLSQGLIKLLKFPKFRLFTMPSFKIHSKESLVQKTIKKEPIIKNLNNFIFAII